MGFYHLAITANLQIKVLDAAAFAAAAVETSKVLAANGGSCCCSLNFQIDQHNKVWPHDLHSAAEVEATNFEEACKEIIKIEEKQQKFKPAPASPV